MEFSNRILLDAGPDLLGNSANLAEKRKGNRPSAANRLVAERDKSACTVAVLHRVMTTRFGPPGTSAEIMSDLGKSWQYYDHDMQCL